MNNALKNIGGNNEKEALDYSYFGCRAVNDVIPWPRRSKWNSNPEISIRE